VEWNGHHNYGDRFSHVWRDWEKPRQPVTISGCGREPGSSEYEARVLTTVPRPPSSRLHKARVLTPHEFELSAQTQCLPPGRLVPITQCVRLSSDGSTAPTRVFLNPVQTIHHQLSLSGNEKTSHYSRRSHAAAIDMLLPAAICCHNPLHPPPHPKAAIPKDHTFITITYHAQTTPSVRIHRLSCLRMRGSLFHPPQVFMTFPSRQTTFSPYVRQRGWRTIKN
jgi:hypothetical protein